MARVVIAMSGGVDSSVAAHLLQQQGHEPIGVFMRHGEESVQACDVDDQSPLLPLLAGRADHKQGCCSAEDAADARRVADHLQIPFYALNLKEDFRGIVDYFVKEYSLGRTPNPCVMCNNWIKFGRLFDYANSVDAEFVAPGELTAVETTVGTAQAAADAAQAAANALRQIAFFQDHAKPTDDDVKPGPIPGLDYYITEYLEEKKKAEDKRVLGCVLQDLLNCARGCDDHECDKPAARTEPASWIYYPAPSKKNCVLKGVLGF